MVCFDTLCFFFINDHFHHSVAQGLCEDEVLNVGEKDEDGSSAGTSVLHSKNLHVDGVDNQSEKLEEGSDKSEPTCETENPQEKLSTDKDIKDELGTLVDSAFETFCNSLDKNVSAGVEAGALTNDANISSEEESAAVLNDTEGEKHCFQYSDEDFGCLKTNIISDVSNLLMARGMAFVITCIYFSIFNHINSVILTLIPS